MREVESQPLGSDIRAALFLLKESLEKEKKLAQRGITLETVYNKTSAVHGALDTIVRDQISLGMRVDRHRKDFNVLRRRVDQISGSDPDELEDTGSFRIEDAEKADKIVDLQKKWDEKEREKRDSITWWKRQRFLWVGITATIVAAALSSGCVSFGIWWLTHAR